MRQVVSVSALLSTCLVLACGSPGGGPQPGADLAESTAAGQVPEVRTTTAAQASQQAAVGVLNAANRDACRANMRSLSTAEAMYFGQFGTYGSLSSISSTGTMGNALMMVCPVGSTTYSLAVTGGGYQIYCCSVPEHGSIIDGMASWQ